MHSTQPVSQGKAYLEGVRRRKHPEERILPLSAILHNIKRETQKLLKLQKNKGNKVRHSKRAVHLIADIIEAYAEKDIRAALEAAGDIVEKDGERTKVVSTIVKAKYIPVELWL